MINGVVGVTASATKKGVPGIPLAALNAIEDPNTRAVLQSIVDGWHVRNGSTGNGDASFVTRAEVDGLSRLGAKQETTNLLRSMNMTPGNISKALNDLHTQVFESLLFKKLEERVDLIDKPDGIFDRLDATELALKNEVKQRTDGDTALSTNLTAMGTRVGKAETAISTEVEQRVNGDNALQKVVDTQYAAVNTSLSALQTSTTTNANDVAALTKTVTTLEATVGTNTAAIATEAEARANADGDLYAQYTLRIDVDGRVSGFGLASDEESSDFIIRADRFSIVSPDGQNKAALIMANNTINVYDENGALRVRIGKLS